MSYCVMVVHGVLSMLKVLTCVIQLLVVIRRCSGPVGPLLAREIYFPPKVHMVAPAPTTTLRACAHEIPSALFGFYVESGS